MTGYYTYMDNKGGYNNAGKVVEVLAPAGSLDICKAVINAGADAVYLGGDMFGARAYAGNLNQEEMFEALDYAHKLDRHIYLTVNTLLKQNEIEGQLIDYIAPFYERGLDAVIVQDLGVMRLIRQNFPDMDIHASTQMTQTGVEGAGLLYKAGAVRVVTSREMTLGEIKKLHEAYPDMEIESFVHGAMCYCYSGQCLMSSFNGGRSGNRGRCAQPCRLPYKVYDGQNIINNQDEKYALSPKDMCALKILPDVIDAGVYSLKIEGRMKNVTYAAYVTSIYRKYVDKYIANGRKGYKVSDKDIEQLCDIYNRGAFTTGFYDTGKGRDMMALTRPNHWGVKALQVVSNVKGKITFKALTDINRQDVFEIDKEHSFESGSDIKKGQTMVVNLPKKYDLVVGKVLNRMKNAYLTELVKKSYVDCNTCISVDIYFKALKGEKAELTISSKDVYVTVYGEEVQQASKQAATKENIKNKLLMMGQTGYIAGQVEVVIDSDIFMPVSEIKKLRREALLQLDKKLIEVHQRSCKITATEEINDSYKQDGVQHKEKECFKSVYLYNVQHLDTVLMTENVKRVYIDFDIFYRDEDEFSKALGKAAAASDIELYIGLPYILTQDNHELLCSLFDYVDTHFEGKVKGYLVRNLEEAGLLAERKKLSLKNNRNCYDIITDAGLYIFNTYAKNELKDILENADLNMKEYTLPYELNASELKSVCGKGSELIVYGRAPLMVSKQCVRKTYGKCDKKNKETLLKQNTDREYIVKSVCSFCYTVTRAGAFDLSKEDVLDDMSVSSYRYEFDNESEEQIRNILNNKSDIDYKGHFYRGVN